MVTYSIAFLLAGLLAAALTPLVRNISLQLGFVDTPTDRKIHKEAIPRLGGIAMVVSFSVPLIGLFLVNTKAGMHFVEDEVMALVLLIGGAAMAGVGLLDDVKGLGAKRKLLLQTIIALGAFLAGLRIEVIGLPFIGNLNMGIFSLPVTLLWIIGVSNAFNLIDGLDGLAAGVGILSCITIFILGLLGGKLIICVIVAALCGSLVGFLIYNFHPAKIFMGDSGSLFIGYVLATGSLMASLKATTMVAILVPMLALGLPIMDTLFSIVRRYLERRPIFAPDRGHLHHRLVDMGLTQRRAVLILYGFSFIFAVAALLIAMGKSFQMALGLVVVTVLLIGIVRFFGYYEYLQKRHHLRARIRDHEVERLRHVLPSVLVSLHRASIKKDLKEALRPLITKGHLDGIYLMDEKEKVVWQLENNPRPLPPGKHQRKEGSPVVLRFPLKDQHKGNLVFTWTSEKGEAGPQMDIMLQLVSDEAIRLLLPQEAPLSQPLAQQAEGGQG